MSNTHEKKQYPIRTDVVKKLPKLAKDKNWKILLKDRPPGKSKSRMINDLLKQGYIVGSKYADTIARSKISIFDCGIYRYPLVRFLEGMACNTLVMSNAPLTPDKMKFIPDVNYVEINLGNWDKKLKYYLEHDDHRKVISENGYNTFLNHHTADIRAKEVLAFLETNR